MIKTARQAGICETLQVEQHTCKQKQIHIDIDMIYLARKKKKSNMHRDEL